jgi:hypothetical protein
MPNDTLPDWEQVLSSAAHLQRILPGAVLVGGSAASVYARHRLSTDADHVLTDLRQRFDQVLAELQCSVGADLIWVYSKLVHLVRRLVSAAALNGVRQASA